MADHQWMKFWPQDWQRDPALRACSLAARGLWMEMICIAHDADPYGFVFINGKPATVRQIASIVGIGEKDAAKLLAELEDAGVFSRDEAGSIYSRRMVRDNAVRAKAREFGKGGGNPALKKPITPSGGGGDNGGVNPPLNLQEAEAEAEAEREETPPVQPAPNPARTASAKPPPVPRGSRLPDDWSPTPEDRAFAEVLGIDPDREAEQFRDYWRSVAGEKGRKLDWSATWRNSVRRVAGFRSKRAIDRVSAHDARAWSARQMGLIDDDAPFVVIDGGRAA